MYFITQLNGPDNRSRPNRKAGNGTWKSSQMNFVEDSSGKVIGTKILFNYQRNNKNTDWLMHEYTSRHDYKEVYVYSYMFIRY